MTHYQKLETPAAVDQLLQPGAGRVLIFKHSLTCPISHAAFSEFQRFLTAGAPADLRVELIEVQNARPAAQRVAELTGVRHESPQALLLAGGEVLWHRSHWEITAKSLATAASAAQG